MQPVWLCAEGENQQRFATMQTTKDQGIIVSNI